jgi:hypothetical protein
MSMLNRRVIVALFLLSGVLGGLACNRKPKTKEETTKEIISTFLDACKAGKNEDAVKQFNDFLPEKDKGRTIDLSGPEAKQKSERLCREVNQQYGNGYEFGTSETRNDMIAWKVFPKGSNEGQLWAFQQVDNKWKLIDIDPAKR